MIGKIGNATERSPCRPERTDGAVWVALCKAKLHCVNVTEAMLHYEGSVSIDRALLDAVGILPFEIVQVTNLANGTLWRTYTIPAPAGSGVFCLNGPPARHFQVGDQAIVVSTGYCEFDKVANWTLRVAFVDQQNRLLRVGVETIPLA